MVGIGVRHADALGRQPIQVGGFHVAAALDAQVAITQVVGDDQDDVGPARRLGVGRARCDQHQGGKKEDQASHWGFLDQAVGSTQMGEDQARSMMVGASLGLGGAPLRSASQVDQRQEGFSSTRT